MQFSFLEGMKKIMPIYNSKRIDTYIFKPFEAIFSFISKKINFTFANAFTSGLFGFIVIIYLIVFLKSTMRFSSGTVYQTFNIVLIIVLSVLCLLAYNLHFGLLAKKGVPCFSADLNLLNSHINNNSLVPSGNFQTSLSILESIKKLPDNSMKAALIYPSVIMAAAVIQQIIIGTVFDSLMMFIGISTAIIINVFITSILSELLTGEMRSEIKRYLYNNQIQFKESFTSSIRNKFIFINVLVFISMIELGLIFYLSSAKGLILLPVIFAILTALIVAVLLLLYFLSIQFSLHDIESAAVDLAKGGTGKLFLRSSDKEVVKASLGFIKAVQVVNDLRENLENKINERTSEFNSTMDALQHTLNEMQKLKQQQDGDYFLISLLLEPLNMNKASCVNLAIDFYIEEKKKFQFKKWNKEIGGDICLSSSFFLKNKLYAVILNADAMGKSIQGAGGAIVLGSVFQALINRTRFSSMEQEKYPEEWLHMAYVEMQRVFESFDGSMLISLVLSLVDDENGLMYYINVEHPWTVLYRNKKSQFIENELMIRKLGVPDRDMLFAVKLYQFKPGDVIIMGSDGRDDLLIPNENEIDDVSSERNQSEVMNEDESLFLKMVEKGNGNLKDIYSSIIKHGKVTDDISMIRISYKEHVSSPAADVTDEMNKLIDDIKSIQNESPEQAIEMLKNATGIYKKNPVIIKKLVKLLVNKKDYKTAVPYLDQYNEINPIDTDMIYIYSYSLMKIKKYTKAAEFAERIVFRNPENIRYLLHLAKIYIILNNYFEADKLLDKVIMLSPENEKALAMKNSM